MATDLIRYDLMVQEALRGVVRRVLEDAMRNGLPGEHHFYITFKTHFAGVRLSDRMRERYPDEMTIILQHQFWDLSVTDHAFEVGLSFSGIPERLLIPFEALTGFFDPSAQFGIKFEVEEPVNEANANDAGEAPPVVPRAKVGILPKPVSKEAKPAKETKPSTEAGGKGKAEKPAATSKDSSKIVEKLGSSVPETEASPGDPKVISIDAFRKKS